MATTSALFKGCVLKLNNDLAVAADIQFVSPGKGSAFYRVKLKSLSTGKAVEHTFKSGETVDIVQVERLTMQYLYKEREQYAFMNMETYEQVLIGAELMGAEGKYLKEGLEAVVAMFEGRAVAVTLPKKITYAVIEAPPAVKGDTASGNVTKEIVLDNGLRVQAPIFIKQGDTVVINTETGEYVERA